MSTLNFDLSNPETLKLDLTSARPKDLLALVAHIETHIAANQEPGPLDMPNGWYDITPAIALSLLQRNRPGANRKVDPPTVYYYAQQMARADWVPTGEPVIFSAGVLRDAQHRLLAGVASGVTFHSYVVSDVPPHPALFAYINNNRVRTAATALQTAGFNGVAPAISQVIKIAEEIRAGIYNPNCGVSRLPRMSPSDVLKVTERYPHARTAARSAASDWQDAVKYVGRKEVITYLGMRILDLFGEEKADEFFTDLVDNTPRPTDHPIAAVRKVIDKDHLAEKPMKRKYMLAALIKAFNTWRKGETMGRRWMLQVHENFPDIEVDTEMAEAAE